MKILNEYRQVLSAIDQVNPIAYAKTRNYLKGEVSRLSPYISRGIISTKQVAHQIMKKGFSFEQAEKFLQELAWRDYWQVIWKSKQNGINKDLKSKQKEVENFEIPAAVDHAKTKITAIDEAITNLFKTGYMHNHMRMYVAATCCNVGKSHWLEPAKWMYYHLLDADWGSNALSWQWVAGSNSNKKYYANQENINKYSERNQHQTFLDKSYDELSLLACPEELRVTHIPYLKTKLPNNLPIHVHRHQNTLIYNFYNLDSNWRKHETANRILLLEPSHFEDYPISQHSLNFMIEYAKKNIPQIQIYTGEIKAFKKQYGIDAVISKEHPFNMHYAGISDDRDWLFKDQTYYPSFFKFWNKNKGELKKWIKNL
jgi:deoxyribodipyrimidine photo-lyase